MLLSAGSLASCRPKATTLPCHSSLPKSRLALCPRQHRRIACGAVGGDKDDGADKPDIDALASFLSKEAARLRDSINAGTDEASVQARNQAAASQSSLAQYDELEGKLFKEVGSGGFDAVDFELVQPLGSIVMHMAGQAFNTAPSTAVVAYAARFHPRLSYTQPVITLLKEYLPVARPVACNELLLLKHLCGLPEDKYAAAIERRGRHSAPVVLLLGYFLSAPTDEAATLSTDDNIDSIWLVYKWEGLRPLSMFMQEGPPQAAYGLFKSKESAEEEAWEGRCATLVGVASGLLSAIDFCHSADVVHGSLSSGSVLLGPWQDYKAGGDEALEVKLDGFGFGKWFTYGREGKAEAPQRGAAAPSFGPQSSDVALEAGKREDLQAAALLLAEAFVAGMAPGLSRGLLAPGTAPELPSGTLDRAGLQRLLFDVFHEDIAQFRDYCLQDPSKYERLVDFLDEREGAGWELLDLMLKGSKSALELSQHRFLVGDRKQQQRRGGQGGSGKGSLGRFSLPWSK